MLLVLLQYEESGSQSENHLSVSWLWCWVSFGIYHLGNAFSLFNSHLGAACSWCGLIFGMVDLISSIFFWRVWSLLVLEEQKHSRRTWDWSIHSLEPPILAICHRLCSECSSFVSAFGPAFQPSVPILLLALGHLKNLVLYGRLPQPIWGISNFHSACQFSSLLPCLLLLPHLSAFALSSAFC